MQRLSGLKKQIGLWKSIAMYYWKPFNQRRLKSFYRQFIQPGDMCFDIGAHVGNRTQAWLALGANVIAVEPQPECVKYLKRRFRNMPQITIVDQAVGATSGEAILHVSSANPTISTISDATWREQINRDARYPITWDEQKRVSMTTLDELIARFGVPVFCKIDVENAEFEALSGLSQPLPLLSFEYYPPAMDKTFLCLDRLDSLGSYEFNWSLGETQQLKAENWVDSRKLRESIRGYTTRYQYGDIYARLARK